MVAPSLHSDANVAIVTVDGLCKRYPARLRRRFTT